MNEELDLVAMQPREVPATAARMLGSYPKSRGGNVVSVGAVYTRAIDSLCSLALNGGKRVRSALTRWE